MIIETCIGNICQNYYSVASHIDRLNCYTYDDLKLEKKFEVHLWPMSVNTSLLAISIVETWLFYKGKQASSDCVSRNEFYSTLAEQLIDSKYFITCTLRQDVLSNDVSSMTMNGIRPHTNLF